MSRVARSSVRQPGALLATYVLVCLVGAGPVAAAEGGALATATDPSPLFDELTVTATKVEAPAWRVPLPLTVFDADELDLRGISSLDTLESSVPGMSHGSVPWTAQTSIRGIGNENLGIGGDPGVAFHLDGVYLGQANASLEGFYDIDRIEVLRGPQGTLYGRNATGGVLNVVTRKPSDEMSIEGDALVGSYDRIQARAAANLPILDHKLLSRISVFTNTRDGYHDNLISAKDVDDAEEASARAQLRFLPWGEANDPGDLEILLRAYYSTEGGTGPAPKVREFPRNFAIGQDDALISDDNPFGLITLDPWAEAQPNPKDPRKSRRDAPERKDNVASGGTLEANWRLGETTVTSLTGYRHQDVDTLTDFDGSELPIVDFRFRTDAEQFSEELRAASDRADAPGELDWLVGLFYFHEVADGFADVGLGALPRFFNSADVTTDSYAVFGNGSYVLTDWLRLVGGLRYSYDDREVQNGVVFDLLPGGGFDAAQQESWDALTGDVTVELTPSTDSLYYFRFARGYKSGGFNVSDPANVYDPEYVWAYELGASFRGLLGDRLNTRASAFYYDYQDLQLYQTLEVLAEITNAAQADILGVELEWVAYPLVTESLRFDGSFGWLDATLDRFDSLDGTDVAAGLQDLSGKHLPRAPELELNLGLQYTQALGDYGSLTPRVQLYWQDEEFFRAFNTRDDRQESFTKTDIRLIYDSADRNWAAELFAMNLENEDVIGDIFVGSAIVGSPYVAFYDAPRTVGFRVEYRLSL